MKKRIPILTGITVLVLMAVVAGWFLFRPSEQRIVLHTSPAELDLIVDGHNMGSIDSGSTLIVTGDEAQIDASREGFADYSQHHTFTEETDEIYVRLEPETEAAEDLLYGDQYYQTQRFQTENYERQAEDAHENYPILHSLPEERPEFRAYQGLSRDGDHPFGIHVYVSDQASGSAAFEDWLHDALEEGSVDDYEIIYHQD